MIRTLSAAGTTAAALLLLATPVHAGWTSARDLPSSETFAPAAATAGRGTEVVGYLSLRSQAAIGRFPAGHLTDQTVVQRSGFNEASGFSLASAPSGRAVAAWLWFDGTDDGAETRIECCQRAVAATWDRGRKPRRQVVSRPGEDVRDVTVAMRPDRRAVVAWQVVASGEVNVALERSDGTLRVIQVHLPERATHFQDVFLAVDNRGRTIVNWIEGGLGTGPVRFMTSRDDGAGNFGPPSEVGRAPDVGIGFFKILTDARGRQLFVWTDSSATEDDTIFAATRAADGDLGTPRVLARDATARDAALGPRGDAIVVWTRGRRAYAARRRPERAFGPAQRLPGDVGLAAVGIDARSRTTLVYGDDGVVRARAAAAGRSFGRAARLSRRVGGRTRCGDVKLDVAPNGDAIGLWGCSGREFSNERVQAAVYHR